MKTHLFTYGSLMFEPVWSKVVNHSYQSVDARLHGFKRRKINNQVYPALIPGSEDDYVDGIVYLNVGIADLKTLDEFEGHQYQRNSISCMSTSHGLLTAESYIFKDNCRHSISEEEWDLDWFRKTGIHTFIAEYRGMR